MGHYMTKEERIILQTLLNEKKPVSYIARKLGCCRQTVYNEIRRGQYLHNYGYYDKLRYSADKGQQIHDYNQTAKGRPLKIGNDHAFAAYIEHKIIVDRYSPGCCSGRGAEVPFCYKDMRQYSVQLYRQAGILQAGQPAPMGEMEKESQDRGGRAAGSAPEAAQHRDTPGAYHAARRIRALGNGLGSQRPEREKCTSYTDRATEQTGDHRQAAGQTGGDHTQGHRPNGA